MQKCMLMNTANGDELLTLTPEEWEDLCKLEELAELAAGEEEEDFDFLWPHDLHG